MINKLLYDCMENMYDSTLNRIYNAIDRKSGDIMSGDITPELYLELEEALQKLAKITRNLIEINMPDTADQLFYCTESETLVTLSEIKTQYDTDPHTREQYDNFYQFVNACQTWNNGTLIELNSRPTATAAP